METGGTPSMIPDGDLVRRCLDGEEEAYRLLVQRYQRPIYSLVHRMVSSPDDATDLTQETFVKVFRALDQFDPARNFSSWIYKIASNQAIDYLRKRKLRTISIHADPEDNDRPALDLEDPGPPPDSRLDASLRREHLAGFVERLAPHYKVVVELRYQQQRSYEEITEILELPLGTVKARLHRAHNQLKAWMTGDGDGGGDE